MTERAPFKPHYGQNQILTAGASSASTVVSVLDKSVRIFNSGAGLAYFRIGQGSQTATIADCPIAAGAVLVVEKGQDDNGFGYISAAGSTLQVITGEGGI